MQLSCFNSAHPWQQCVCVPNIWHCIGLTQVLNKFVLLYFVSDRIKLETKSNLEAEPPQLHVLCKDVQHPNHL